MKYQLFSTCVFRTPILPFTQLKDILEDKATVLKKFEDPFIQESIYVASPVLYQEVMKLLKDGINAKESDSIIYSLERYMSRMSTRCTPFGLFAGCSTGKLDADTNIILRKEIVRTTRLDMHHLGALYDALMRVKFIRESIKYYPNTSLYKRGNKHRYVEYEYKGSQRKYHTAEIEGSSYLNRVLNLSRKGASIFTLASSLVQNDITIDEAKEYVNELIDSQILVGELNQCITGDDYLLRIIRLLQKGKASDYLSALQQIRRQILILDEHKGNICTYEEIIKELKALSIPTEGKCPFQVDIMRETAIATVGNSVIEELKSILAFLNKVSARSMGSQTLTQFQQSFYSRYEDREVSLLEALDTECGIGYPAKNQDGTVSPLVDGFRLPSNINQTSSTVTLNGFQSLILKKTMECLANKKQEIELTDEDVNDLPANWDNLPTTLYTVFEVIKSSSDGTLIHFKHCSGSSAANLLGRFAHLGQEINHLVYEITSKEQELESDAVLAEIVYLPEARTGNILSRPHLRKYELPYIANSDLPEERKILPSDLLLSVRNGKLILRSQKLNKQIIPRLTTAHNFRITSMPVYQFLCDIQIQSERAGLYLEEMNLDLPFSPRIRYKNTLLSTAKWIFKKQEFDYLLKIQDDNHLLTEITAWRKKHRLPRYVIIPDADNELFIDLENALSIQASFSIIKKREKLLLKEFLFDPESAIVRGENGAYLNEFIVAFYKEKEK